MAIFTQQNSMADMRAAVIQATLHFAAWVLPALVVGAVFGHSESRLAYGLLSGWWAALYLGYVFAVRIKSIVLSVLFYILVVVIDWYFDLGLFHDSTLLVSLLGLMAYISPILLNAAMRAARRGVVLREAVLRARGRHRSVS